MNTRYALSFVALIPAMAAGFVLPVVKGQEPAKAPMPKMEIEVNGRKIDLNQVQQALETMQIDDNTRELLRKHLDKIAPSANGQAVPDLDIKVNGQPVDPAQLQGMAKLYLKTLNVDEKTRQMLAEQLPRMMPLAGAVDGKSMPKIEVLVNGRKVEMDQVAGMAKQALDALNIDENTCQMLRKEFRDLEKEIGRKMHDHGARKQGAAAAEKRPDKKADEAVAPPAPGPRGPWKIGVACEPVEPLLRAHLQLPDGNGLVVREVIPDSPAAKAGLKPNDVLTRVGDQPIQSYPQLVEAVARSGRTGEALVLKVVQAGKEHTIVIKPDMPPAQPKQARRGMWLGWQDAQGLPDWSARMNAMNDLRTTVDRQQKELAGLRKQLAQQQQELRKLREMLEKKGE